MKTIRQAISFLVHGRIYIALAASALAVQTAYLFTAHPPSLAIVAFVFFATLFAYNIYYIDLKRPVFKYHKLSAVIGFIGTVLAFFFCFNTLHIGVLILLILYGSLYTFSSYLPFRLFQFSLVKISLLTVVWILAVVFLPLGKYVILNSSLILFALHQFIFIFILNFLFDIKDIEFDEKLEKTSLATKFGEENSYFIISFLEISLIALLYFLMVDKSQLIMPYVVPLLIGNIALSYSIRKTKTNRNIFSFLLFIDGLMLLQAFLVLGTYYAIRF